MEEKKPIIKETDLLALIQKLISDWKLILKICIIGFIIGIVVAVSRPNEYTSQVVMSPESSNTSSLGSLGGLASMVGIDIGTMNGNDALYPLLYPDIISSLPFLCGLYSVEVTSVDSTFKGTYYEYSKNYAKEAWFTTVIMAPRRGLKKLFANISGDVVKGDQSKFDPFHLSKPQMAMIEHIQKDLTVFVDKKTEVISISFTSQDPLISAIMADNVKERLQQTITEYRTHKAAKDCSYIQQLYDEAKAEYLIAQKEYADFVDSNNNLIRESARIEQDRLEAEKEIKLSVYQQLAQQLQLSKAKVQESTPAFTVMKPASIPAEKSNMRKLVVIFIWCFVSFILSCCYIMFKDPIITVWNTIKHTNKIQA